MYVVREPASQARTYSQLKMSYHLRLAFACICAFAASIDRFRIVFVIAITGENKLRGKLLQEKQFKKTNLIHFRNVTQLLTPCGLQATLRYRSR